MKDSTFITRVILQNYKSIASCDVQLQPLTFLVGRNGAGKSNFLDALHFVADALNSSLDHAVRTRGGISDVCKRSEKSLTEDYHFSIRLEFALPDGVTGHYAFQIGTRPSGGYEVQIEECKLQNENLLNPEVYFRVDKGTVTDISAEVAPVAATDRLYLVNASGLSEFRSVYDAFSHMGFYNLNPDKIRDLQAPNSGDMLTQDGSNLTSVFSQLSSSVKIDIEEYMSIVVPSVQGVNIRKFGPKESLEFKQTVACNENPLPFLANNMSDGTLRMLGILVALFQENADISKRMRLIGIEEPELALHPAAAGVLLDGLWDAAVNTQVIVTSHSPDLLDNKDLDVDSILAVEAHDGNTLIAPVDKVGKSIMGDNLCTAGELLRLDQFQPDPTQLPKSHGPKVEQLNLFD